MAGESRMWGTLRPLIAELDPVRIENRVGSGVPDVNTTEGWIELKYLPEWPKRPTTPVKIDHFTGEQRVWATRRRMAGGVSLLLLKVGESEWLLFDGLVAAQVIGTSTRNELYQRVIVRWKTKPKREDITSWIRKAAHSLRSTLPWVNITPLPDAEPG